MKKNKIEKIKLINQSDIGYVCLVESSRDKKKYAARFQLTGTLMQRNNIEIKQLIALNNKNVIRFHEYFVENDTAFMLMEYCEGGSLAERFDLNITFDPRTILFWSCDLLSGLDYLHENKIIHRDVKPENLFLTKDLKNIKLGEPGVARKNSLGNINVYVPNFQASIHYISPEILLKKPHSFSTDIWSAGCIIYELIELKKFSEIIQLGKVTEINQLILNSLDKPGSAVEKNIYECFRSLLKRMLKSNPNDRATIKELKGLMEGSLTENANLYKKEKDFNGAQDQLYKLLELNPHNPITHMNQALIFTEINDFERAKVFYQQTVNIDLYFTNPIFYKNDLKNYKKLLENLVLKNNDKESKEYKDLMVELDSYKIVTSQLKNNEFEETRL